MAEEHLESRTLALGAQLFGDAAADRPVLGSPRWWDERLMGLSMRDEMVKVQLFRFVDVLPALRDDGQVTRHLREYFLTIADRLPAAARPLAGRLGDTGLMAGLVASAARYGANRLARRFIAGTNLPETVATIESLRRQRLAFTVDLLGEAVLSEAEAARYQRQYLHFIAGLADRAAHWEEDPLIDRDPGGPIPAVNISVKLSSLYSQIDPIAPEQSSAAVRVRLRPLLRLARQRGAFVNIDMEQHALKDLTLRIFREVLDEAEFREWRDVGIAIQAYLRSSEEDLRELADWVQRRGTPVWVRLVKGAYWDYETIIAAQQNWPVPVFLDKPATDANFETLTRFLVERHELLRPAIASHNIRSIAHALALAEAHALPRGRIEFQMLYGMADPIKSALVKQNQRVRVYTPFGQLLPGMAYLVRRLLENTSNQSFLRAGFLERVPMEKLLMNPIDLLQRMKKSPASAAGIPIGEQFQNEPLLDFALDSNRAAFASAVTGAVSSFGERCPAIIAGRAVASSAWLDSVNPSHSRQVVGQFPRTTPDDARAAVAAAREAFPRWRDLGPDQRAAYFFGAADIMRRRRLELAACEVHECGKPWREADGDVAEAIDYLNYYAGEMLRVARPQFRNVPGEENRYFYEPRGVAVIIAPWNFPLAILCGMTTAALVSGNTAIMKPSEQSPVIASKLMGIFTEAGLPAGVVNFLPGSGEEVGPVLVDHPDVSVIAFTGSRSVGLTINRQGALVNPGQQQVKRIITEMGGKNAIIVDEDADLDEAVHGVAASAFGYAGQKCSACSRVIILSSIHDAFMARLVEVTRSLRLAPAEDPACFIGPVIDGEAYQRILATIDRAKAEAALLFAGDAGALKDEGYYIPPHIFTDVSPTAWLAQEEIFGPILAGMRADNLEHALAIANGTPYALTGGLYSRSPDSIARVRREFRVGNLYINRKITGALVDRQPFGGFKLSGIGSKAGGPDYLLQFMVPRTITENTLRRGFAPDAGEAATGVGE